MRVLSAMACLWANSTAYAQSGFPGTKQDAIRDVSSGPASPSLMPMLQMAIAAALVGFLLKAVLPRILARANRRPIALRGESIRIEEAASFTGGTLHVVSVRGRTFLLCAGAQGVTMLADLSEQREPSQEAPTFGEMLDSAADRAAHGPPAGQLDRETPDRPERTAIAEALERAHYLSA